MELVIMKSGLIISMSCHIMVVGLWAILASWCSVSMSVWFTIGRKLMDIYTKWCNLLPMSKTPRSCAKISRYRITNMIVQLRNFWLESYMVWGWMNITFTCNKNDEKLLGCHGHYSKIKLSDKYRLLDKFLLHGGGHFEDTFVLGSTLIHVKIIQNKHFPLW
jgi:hypothetical protein